MVAAELSGEISIKIFGRDNGYFLPTRPVSVGWGIGVSVVVVIGGRGGGLIAAGAEAQPQAKRHAEKHRSKAGTRSHG
jgi:hypothetical protein